VIALINNVFAFFTKISNVVLPESGALSPPSEGHRD